MFARMKVRSQFRLLVAMVLVLLVLSNGVGLLILKKAGRDVQKAAELSQTLVSAVDTARGAQVDFKKQVQEWKDILLRGNDRAAFAKYKKKFFSQQKAVRDDIETLRGLVTKLGLESQLLDEFLATHSMLESKYKEGLEHYDTSNNQSYHIVDSMVAGIDRKPTDAMDEIVKYIQENGANLLSQTERKTTAEDRLATTASVTAGIVSLLLITLASILILRNLLKTLGGEPARVNEVAGEIAAGNLAVRLEGDGKANAGSLYASVREMAERLRTVVNGIKSASDNVASASEELSASSSQMSQGVAQQAERAGQIATSAEQMSHTVIDVAKNTSQMADSAGDTVNKAKEGEEIVGRSIDEVKAIAVAVKESSQLVTLLAGRSREIGEIVEVIGDIADQTNLLALNAAIEAARAGEQGRGFAVVADEVRKLAEKTAKSTAEISGMIKTIQEEVQQAFTSMEEGTKRVETGVEYASRAGESLQGIVTSATRLQSVIQQIASATEEMSAASSQISGDIDSIAGISRESSAASEQITRSANDLSMLSAGLLQTVGHFRL